MRYGLAIPCSRKTCLAEVNKYCYNPLATLWTNTDPKEPYHFFHEHRKVKSTMMHSTTVAYYHRKGEPLDNGNYLQGKYYPTGHKIVDEEGKFYPRDCYTFHGFVEIPESVLKSNKIERPGNEPFKHEGKDENDPFKFF